MTVEQFERYARRVRKELNRLEAEIQALTPSGGAVRATLKIGASVPITVDTTGETITLAFIDDHGNETPAPANTVIEFTTSDAAIAAVAPDPSNPLQGDITPGGTPGIVSLGATSNGTALKADGSAIPDEPPVALEVDPGAPVGERLKLAPNA